MADNALLKIGRASKHLVELNELFNKVRPFAWIVETNTTTGSRTLRIEENEPVANASALICGDVVHNLRSALDLAYWEVVSPRCATDGERRRLEFPFVETADRLDGRIQRALCHYAGTGFYCAIRGLKPHGGPGGNGELFLIHELDILDKHRLLIPTTDHTKFSEDVFRQHLPDYRGIGGNAVLTRVEMRWNNRAVPPNQLGTPVAPTLHMYKRTLNIPVEAVIAFEQPGAILPMVPMLNALIKTTRQTIEHIRNAARSY